MIEIRCTRENLREELSDLFPNPFEDQTQLIEDCVSHANAGVMVMGINAETGERVKVTIVPDDEPSPYRAKRNAERETLGEALSASQGKIPQTPEEDDAWRVLESQRATEGLEDHAARRAQIKLGGSGYYARTPDDSLPTQQAAGRVIHGIGYFPPALAKQYDEMLDRARAALPEGVKHVATVHDAEYYVPDSKADLKAMRAEAADNANTAEVGTFTDGPEERYSAQPIGFYGAFVVEDRQNPTDWIAKCVKQEFAELIVDALNAWEASQ